VFIWEENLKRLRGVLAGAGSMKGSLGLEKNAAEQPEKTEENLFG